MKVFVEMLPDMDTILDRTGVLHDMKRIGQVWKTVLTEQRPVLEELMKDSALKEAASACIDVIEDNR